MEIAVAGFEEAEGKLNSAAVRVPVTLAFVNVTLLGKPVVKLPLESTKSG